MGVEQKPVISDLPHSTKLRVPSAPLGSHWRDGSRGTPLAPNGDNESVPCRNHVTIRPLRLRVLGSSLDLLATFRRTPPSNDTRRDNALAWRFAYIECFAAEGSIEVLEQLPSSLLHNDRVPYQGPADSKPAASHDGAATGDAINLRNSIATEGDALLAGTPGVRNSPGPIPVLPMTRRNLPFRAPYRSLSTSSLHEQGY